MMWTLLRAAAPGLLLVWAVGCSTSKTDLVATMGDQVITTEEFEAGFSSNSQSFASYEYELQQRREFLEDMIDQKLLVIGAYQQGLDQNQEIQRLLEQQQGKFLLDQLYKQEVVDRVIVSDEEVRAHYENLGMEIHARHILLKTEEEAISVRGDLDGGADFAELAREKSIDPSAAQNAGDLSWFRWGAMVPAFQDVAFALSENDISSPVQTNFGWHVIQHLGKREVDRQPYEQIKLGIEQQLIQQRTQTRVAEFLAEIKAKAELRFDVDQLKLVQDTYRDTTGGPLPFKANLDPEELNYKLQLRPIVRYLDTSLATGEFLKLANQAPPMNRPDFDDTLALKEFIFKMVYTKTLEREARLLRIDHSDAYKENFKQFKEVLMADKMRTDLVSRPVDVTAEQILAYYEGHSEEFSSPPQVNVREALVATQAEADQIMERVRRGEKFADICKKVTLRQGFRAKSGDLGTFRRFEYPNLFDAAQKMGLRQVGGPVFHSTKGGGQWSVIELISKKDAITQDFASVESRILGKLKSSEREAAFESWLDEIRQASNVQINEEALSSTIDESKYPEKG